MSNGNRTYKNPHVVKAHKYARDVVSGRINASKKTIQCCQRQLDDLKKKNWKYVFSNERAENVCKFIELLPHVKGSLMGKNIVLEPWQCFWLCTLFGWLERGTNIRRFTKAFTFLPRKNGKSVISAGIFLYMLSKDNEGGAECYSAATTRDQAKIVFDMAKSMARKRPKLLSSTQMRVLTHQITCDKNDGKGLTVSADAHTLDGLNPHYASIDELHAHKTREVYDVMETAMGAREQPLINVITTAGTNIVGICYEIYDYCSQILSGGVEDDSMFCLIFEADKGDDFKAVSTWKKANPNYGISVGQKYLEGLAKKASVKVTAQANFKTKHLNIWVKSHTQYISLEAWERTMVEEWELDRFLGCRVRIALDLSQKRDMTAMTLLFEDGEHKYAYTKYYMPEDNVEEYADRTYSLYRSWAENGYFTLTPGNVVDYEYIKQDILKLAQKFDVVDVTFDKWQAQYLMQQLQAEGIEVVEFQMSTRNLSEPMKQMEADVRSGKLHTGKDPVLCWMATNLVAYIDARDNVYPRKEKAEDKIDGIVSLIMAYGRAMVDPDHGESIYSTMGIASG